MHLSTEIFDKVALYTTQTALHDGVDSVSYADLNEISLRIANILTSLPNKRPVVGVVGQRNFSVYFGLLGSLYSGGTYVPINSKYSHGRIIDIISQSGITVLIGQSDSISSLSLLLPNTSITTIIIPDSDPVEMDFASCIQLYTKSDIQRVTPLIQPVIASSSDILYILFTSGSTGTPKGVMISYENAFSYLNNIKCYYNLQCGYKASQTFDLSFDVSFVDTFLTWYYGGQLCILSESELIMPFDYIQRNHLNLWFSVPTLISFMHKMGYLQPNSFPSLKYSLFAGEPLTQKLADAWQSAAPNSTIENHYGPTEATVTVTRYFYTNSDTTRQFSNNILPIGQVHSNLSFEIVDENLFPSSKGQKGQLIVKGSQISKGYIGNPKKTSESFTSLPWDESGETWYLTGDLACINENNEIECFGRIDNQIKIAGRRIELGEIEQTLMSTNLLSDIVVVPVYSEGREISHLTSYTTSQLIQEDKIKILTTALELIEKLFLPRNIICIESFPLTSSVK